MPATVEGAVAYWSKRLGGDGYTEESDERKQAALVSAQDSLARYTVGLKAEDVEAAVYEQALWLLGSRAELQAAGVTSFSVTGLSESYDVKGRPAGIGPDAWRIIQYGVDGTGGRCGGGGAAWLW